MKKKRSIIILIIGIIIIAGIIAVLFNFLNDANKLTVEERNWINDNINTVQNINVINDTNIFGKDGSGVFYDFLNDFSGEYEMTINPITYTDGNKPSGLTFGTSQTVAKNDVVFFKDHYVLVGKKAESIYSQDDLEGKTIGIVSSDLTHISKYVSGITYSQTESKAALYEAFAGELEYIMVPLTENLDTILSKDYHILYHFSDINVYYVMHSADDILSNVLTKYYNKWQENFDSYYYEAEFSVFTKSLNIPETEIDKMQSVTYDYGFINNSPYEIIMGGEYGGIVGVYLSRFSSMSDVEFNFVKYKNYEAFTKGIASNDIKLYFNYYNFEDDYTAIKGPNIEYSIIARRDNDIVIASLKSLIGEEVYVQKDTKLYNMIKGIDGISIKTYNNTKELLKLNKEDVIIILDKNIYNSNAIELDNYTVRYEDYANSSYEFKVKGNETLTKLLSKYVATLDPQEMQVLGIENHFETVKSGSLIATIAEYIIYLAIIAAVILFIIIRKSKKISIARKIKKEDKLKFIDQLTSLKNRNFLNENIEIWNNNTVYPQTIIAIDLNKVQEINDLHGYNEGDKQIQSAANALVKTQLDNSEIMRTDGNEFVIYLVGYNQKQVTNYIHKLNKELNKLPYDFGAEFGYSMITDDIKTIEDAMNEAVEDMKKQKSNENEKDKK